MLSNVESNIKKDANQISLGGALFDQSLGRISRANKSYELEPRVSELLTLLCSTDAILSRESILNLLWGDSGSDEALTQAISKLRRALGDTTRPHKIIETMPKRGYRLLATPEPINTSFNLQNKSRAHNAFGGLFSSWSNTSHLHIGGVFIIAILLFGSLSFLTVQKDKTIEIELECPDHFSMEECISLIQTVDKTAR